MDQILQFLTFPCWLHGDRLLCLSATFNEGRQLEKKLSVIMNEIHDNWKKTQLD